MDLKSDFPFWTVRNGLQQVFPALDRDLHCDALVIGGGISGALLAHRLVGKNVDCILVDRRDIGFGSTSASTALLQYEIDIPLTELRQKVGDAAAERAYRAGIESIDRLHSLAGKDCDFACRPSVQIASRVADSAGLHAEYKLRKRLRFPVTWLDRSDLSRSGINAECGLRSSVGGEVDPYRLTHRLMRLAVRKGLRVYDRTTVLRYDRPRRDVTAVTDRGYRIRCRKIFFATGYETLEILPPNCVSLKSTYALISEPLANPDVWKDRSLLWGTGDPYLYMRTTSDSRIIVGGQDDTVLNPERRDRQIPTKTKQLISRFQRIFPQIRIEPAFSWAGVFGSSKDGLAFIGSHPAFPRAYFALGFGGNGITFAEIASRILTDLFLDRPNPDQNVFGFAR